MGAVKRRIWRPDDTVILNSLLAAGRDRFAIAKEMKRPVNTIVGQLRKMGLCKPRGRIWTDEEVNKVVELHLAGRTPLTIANAVGRNTSSTRRKIAELYQNGTIRRRKALATVVVPVAQSDWMKPLTKAQLMGRRA